jgi:hypothetical protein
VRLFFFSVSVSEFRFCLQNIILLIRLLKLDISA